MESYRAWTIFEPKADAGTDEPLIERGRHPNAAPDQWEAIEVVPASHLAGAVATLEQIAAVLDRGTADERKLATINRLVHNSPALPRKDQS